MIEMIKEWLKIENEIKLLSKEISSRRKNKKTITEKLDVIMEKNNFDVINTSNGTIERKKTEVKKPLNSKSLSNILKKYYSEKNKQDESEELASYLLENRETNVKSNIKFKQNK